MSLFLLAVGVLASLARRLAGKAFCISSGPHQAPGADGWVPFQKKRKTYSTSGQLCLPLPTRCWTRWCSFLKSCSGSTFF